jgi:hypothetical protein
LQNSPYQHPTEPSIILNISTTSRQTASRQT